MITSTLDTATGHLQPCHLLHLLASQIVQRTDVGLGEAYMDGDFLVNDLAGFMAVMVANARNLEGQKGLLGVANWINDKMLAAAHARRSNTREGKKRMHAAATA